MLEYDSIFPVASVTNIYTDQLYIASVYLHVYLASVEALIAVPIEVILLIVFLINLSLK